jgi:shikimate 5-dehydrogenase
MIVAAFTLGVLTGAGGAAIAFRVYLAQLGHDNGEGMLP